jgi:hypothetical protein
MNRLPLAGCLHCQQQTSLAPLARKVGNCYCRRQQRALTTLPGLLRHQIDFR